MMDDVLNPTAFPRSGMEKCFVMHVRRELADAARIR
jgi:hypothetical protein